MKTVTIIGKPNVGKSSLFNALVKKKIAIVNSTEGLTRDLKIKNLDIDDFQIKLVDSPGFTSSKNKIEKEIKEFTINHLKQSDLVLLVIDAKGELTLEDFESIKLIRKLEKKNIVVLNKTEGKFNFNIKEDVKNLGFKSLINISAAHMQGIEELKEMISVKLNFGNDDLITVSEYEVNFSLAIVGKTNCGKSTLMNSLKGKEIAITGNIPNLTRDSVETFLSKNNKIYKIIDTAGFSKNLNGERNINKVFIDQTKKKIRLSQIILIMMDIEDYYERLHSRIIKLVYEEYRCMILVINKIDKNKNFSEVSIRRKIYELNPQIVDLPIFFISAKKKVGLSRLIEGITRQYTAWTKRISTGKLNSWLEEIIKKNPPPLHKGKSIKLKFISQINTSPPKFIIFVNFNNALRQDYKRFIENNLKKKINLNGLPLKIIYRRSDNPYDK